MCPICLISFSASTYWAIPCATSLAAFIANTTVCGRCTTVIIPNGFYINHRDKEDKSFGALNLFHNKILLNSVVQNPLPNLEYIKKNELLQVILPTQTY